MRNIWRGEYTMYKLAQGASFIPADVIIFCCCTQDKSKVNKATTEQERRKGIPWTEEEHRLFLMGLAKFGKGDWRSISRNFVVSRTPTQARVELLQCITPWRFVSCLVQSWDVSKSLTHQHRGPAGLRQQHKNSFCSSFCMNSIRMPPLSMNFEDPTA